MKDYASLQEKVEIRKFSIANDSFEVIAYFLYNYPKYFETALH